MKYFIKPAKKEEFVIKARTHKYIKRTGSSGNYKYWYRMPDGSLKAADDAKTKAKAQLDHAKRLLLGRRLNKHTKTDAQIATEVGIPLKQVRNASATVARGVHGYGTEEIAEGSGPAKKTGEGAFVGPGSGIPALEEAKKRERATAKEKKKFVDAGFSETSHGYKKYLEPYVYTIEKNPAVSGEWMASRTNPDDPTEALSIGGRWSSPENAIAAVEAWAEGERATPTPPTPTPMTPTEEAAIRAIPARLAGESTPTTTEPSAIEQLRAKLKADTGLDLGAIEKETSTARARRAETTAKAAAAPTSPESRELHSTSPSLRDSDAKIQQMIEQQQAGGNPYYDRSKELYNKTKDGLKPERKKTTDYMFQAIEKTKREGELSEAALTKNYKEISGSSIRGLSVVGGEFEKATFIQIDEIVNNPPIDAEVERMKRGYAAKQIARFMPYIKDEFKRANPSFPPPYPTFADVKSWKQAGGRPDWAPPLSKMAVPREVQEAAPRGPDGSIWHPPQYLPLHLAPAWAYIVKSAGKEGKNPYQATTPTITQTGELGDLGLQAGPDPQGYFLNALRKYVQMRGENNLVDIPKSKLGELGLSHADIFKGEAEDLMKILTTKIIDNAALLPYIKEAMGIKKSSVSLVVDKNGLYKSKDVRKAELIQKIKTLKKSIFYVV